MDKPPIPAFEFLHQLGTTHLSALFLLPHKKGGFAPIWVGTH